MERLTNPDSRFPIDQNGGLCVTAKFISRLADYEDTGLAPEEIDHLRDLTKMVEGIEPDRLREIVEAEKDGRVVILPTLDTGIIRRMDDLGRVVIPKIVRSKLGLCADNYPPMMIIGCEDGIFLREYRTEAEAALKGGEGNGRD